MGDYPQQPVWEAGLILISGVAGFKVYLAFAIFGFYRKCVVTGLDRSDGVNYYLTSVGCDGDCVLVFSKRTLVNGDYNDRGQVAVCYERGLFVIRITGFAVNVYRRLGGRCWGCGAAEIVGGTICGRRVAGVQRNIGNGYAGSC